MPGLLSGWGWLAVIPVLGLLVFVHELGHFLAARWMKVEVEEFGFGYPPRLATLFERNGVKYTINLLPLGGFVRMVGEEGDYYKEGSLYQKRPWQRAVVLAAGPAMNLILAALVMALGPVAGCSPVSRPGDDSTGVTRFAGGTGRPAGR